MRLVDAFQHPASGWRAVARLAAGQHGNVTTAQLRACGLSPTAIRGAVARGQLWTVHRSVYAVGRPPVSPHERAMAAVLAGGSGAVLSHHWAGWLWKLRPLPTGPVEITAARQRHARRNLILHRSRSLDPQDATTEWGIPTTTAARTVLDLAPSLTAKHLGRAVNDAQIKRLTTADDLRQLATRSPGRATRCLTATVPLDQHGATRSLLEDLLFDVARERGWAPPRINLSVERIECDFTWPALKLIIEADGYTYHSTRDGFESDHERRLALEALGWRVVAVTYDQVIKHRATTAARLTKIYAAACSAQSRYSSQ